MDTIVFITMNTIYKHGVLVPVLKYNKSNKKNVHY